MRSTGLSTPFAVTSGEKPGQAGTLETCHFYISSKKTSRTSVLRWLRPRTGTAISANKNTFTNSTECEASHWTRFRFLGRHCRQFHQHASFDFHRNLIIYVFNDVVCTHYN